MKYRGVSRLSRLKFTKHLLVPHHQFSQLVLHFLFNHQLENGTAPATATGSITAPLGLKHFRKDIIATTNLYPNLHAYSEG